PLDTLALRGFADADRLGVPVAAWQGLIELSGADMVAWTTRRACPRRPSGCRRRCWWRPASRAPGAGANGADGPGPHPGGEALPGLPDGDPRPLPRMAAVVRTERTAPPTRGDRHVATPERKRTNPRRRTPPRPPAPARAARGPGPADRVHRQ